MGGTAVYAAICPSVSDRRGSRVKFINCFFNSVAVQRNFFGTVSSDCFKTDSQA